ncbi:kugelei, partial [Carabus blaptoides fortunei]
MNNKRFPSVKTGVVTLMNLGNFGTERTTLLNISVSDGVYTNLSRLKVDLLPANLHSPVFTEAAVAENKPSGQYVATVKATDEDFGELSTVVYSIHSAFLNEKFNIDKFAIDDQAQLCLAAPLDFEIKESHLIGILAETDASTMCFENGTCRKSLYTHCNVALSVIAHGEDQGSNSEVRYSFSSDVGDAANVFSIDAHTGWITNLVSLDKEERPEYKFHHARLIVRLKDYNDKPSLFKRKVYEAAVNEDVLP